MKCSPIYLVVNWLIIFSIFAPLPTMATVDAPPAGFLAQLAASATDEIVSIIVQKQGQHHGAEQLVQAGGGKITQQLPMINAFVATVPAQLIPKLQQSTDVRQISLDAPVQSQSSDLTNSLRVSDEFNMVAYNGSNGAFPWLTDWQEIGEADGATQGNIGVTTFWGGALQGLRLQGRDKGAMRAIDLTSARNVQVQISYRRKSFRDQQDFVALQRSTDGLTWTEVTRWSGALTDSQIQHESYDISASGAGKSSLRFITSSTMGNDARFYIDRVSVTFTSDWDRNSQSANQVYLPLIETDTSRVMGADGASPLTKAERLAHLAATALDCSHYCINLNQLASTYIKAIHAEQLWDIPPYPRGTGVRVAVVDSGISPHPDLNDDVGHTRVITHVNFVLNSPLPDDFYGHGTHLAGIIAGNGQSSGGAYVGVAPEAELVDIKVMDDWGRGNTADVLAGLQWIYNNRVQYQIGIVNLSLNSTIP